MTDTTKTNFHRRVSLELARAGLTQRALAQRMGLADTTLSDWLRGAHPAPADLAARIESALSLAVGTLSADE